jgi:uncharacterized protein YegP (UPF0339 family)
MPVSIERGKGKASKQFYLRVTGRNNELIVAGETVKQKQSAVKSILALYKQLAVAFSNYSAISTDPKELIKQLKSHLVDNTKKVKAKK